MPRKGDSRSKRGRGKTVGGAGARQTRARGSAKGGTRALTKSTSTAKAAERPKRPSAAAKTSPARDKRDPASPRAAERYARVRRGAYSGARQQTYPDALEREDGAPSTAPRSDTSLPGGAVVGPDASSIEAVAGSPVIEEDVPVPGVDRPGLGMGDSPVDLSGSAEGRGVNLGRKARKK